MATDSARGNSSSSSPELPLLESPVLTLPEYVEHTPAGEKKYLRSFEDPHCKTYNPVAEKSGFFNPGFAADEKVREEGSFVIPVPPPNVTGALHMGHALGNSLQDILIRWSRMQGKTTLWVPGCGHAGIATQTVVEKMLWRREKKTRHHLGREEFIGKVWEWKAEYHERINNTFEKMGSSLDWSREAFTMDGPRQAAVTEQFVSFHDEGIIYRANRLVNWCTALNTALSNLEVINRELTGRTLLEVPGYEKKIELGVIVHFKYPIEGSDETIEVDLRYKHLVGKTAIHPFLPGRKLPIVADKYYMDKEFGTGAVKLTPGHDSNDFHLGKQHDLEFISILTDNDLMNENTGPCKGLKRFDVRYKIQDDLKKLGLYVDKRDNHMRVPLCERSGDVIEPILKPQWWMRMRERTNEAVKVVKASEIRIRPESAEKSFYRWMENIQDWCISRQLWWGHRILSYFARFEGGAGNIPEDTLYFSGRTQEEAETADLERLFPTSLLETGWDILFFWVARMIMLGLKLTGQVPFREVYCHGLIRDSKGRKMSKSLGNVIDPFDLDELPRKAPVKRTAFPQGIPEYSAWPPIRLGEGDINFDIKVMHAYRRFANMIWQASKIRVCMEGSNWPSFWILHKLNEALAGREFMKVANTVYGYWYNQLCDVFIENSKARVSTLQTLYSALEAALLLIHPFMPFVTEELWQRLPRRPGDETESIILAKYPIYQKELDSPDAQAACELVLSSSKGIRSLMAEYALDQAA
ncbi:hypothetical protein QBC46DRAFT_360570 [Diplogelasinospora grovesii]|uniref:valine--tRNA ligase n=1 Tax=Diplogelasinospora grovesii TaxID=303347 RepID=A0AAN6NFR1_9PEZI|nr:hypothetical protein QBC46DRAFT_360570 [Diplogelasinospora grovesii]